MDTPTKRAPRKISITIQLDRDQCEDVDRIAALRRTGRAAVVREAVAIYLLENSSETASRFPVASEAA